MDLLIYNKIKIYPDFKQTIEFKTPIVNLNALTDLDKITRKRKNSNNRPDFSSVSRTRIAIKDIVLCNDFDWFCTFTFAKNRDDVDHCKTQFSQWLKNQKPHSPNLTYLAVPEWHKDKKAIHFHVLLKNYAGAIKKTEFRTKKGFKVFQIPGYRLGYNTAVPIIKTNENKEKVANYITKYISKELFQNITRNDIGVLVAFYAPRNIAILFANLSISMSIIWFLKMMKLRSTKNIMIMLKWNHEAQILLR